MRFRYLLLAAGLICLAPGAPANMVVTPWISIFKGVERAAGTNYPDGTIPRLQVVNCVRIDLQDLDVRVFTTPRASPTVETLSLSVSNFLKQHALQVATDANFYQPSDPASEGTAINVEGFLVTTGQVVSPYENTRFTSILLTSNNVASLSFSNAAPNTSGVFTAVSGFYPVLTNGIYPGDSFLSTTYPDPTIHQRQPRTIHGLSSDRRYLYFMIIDGRQGTAEGFNPPYSDGAVDSDSAAWATQFGMSDAVMMDGGGSTAMYMADCVGNPVPLGRSSLAVSRNRERYIGAHIGVSTRPLPEFINEVVATPGSATAIITWDTDADSTSQVEYGRTPSYGTFSALDSALVTNHLVTLSGLSAGVKYYFRVLSVAGGTQYSSSCGVSSFTTTNVGVTLAFGLTNDWKYNTANLDGVNWQATNFDDIAWAQGTGVLWADSRAGTFPSPSANLIPNYFTGQRMPIDPVSTYPYMTYYFRTRFVFSGPLAGASLILSNYFDDGVVFYLNGAELVRANMPTGTILNSTPSLSNPCSTGNATCPTVLTLTNDAIDKLVIGTNVLTAEVHNQVFNSPDVTFESALFYVVQPASQIITNVIATPGETSATIAWTTTTNATTQIQYGLTPALGGSNALDNALVSSHSVTLSGLQPLTTYYFRVLSTAAGNSYFTEGTFATVPFLVPLVTEANIWKFTTNNLDSTNWFDRDYDDSAWLGQGAPLLFIEDNAGVSPRTTALPAQADGSVMPTYFFRTHFVLNRPTEGLVLLFTNFIDDGAVFYLNGTEINRLRMPAAPQPITYDTLSVECPINSCEATLDVPDIFRAGNNALTNLIMGDNVLAVRVHQFTTNDSDVVFGSSMSLVRAIAAETPLTIARSGNQVCLSWGAQFLTLQRASSLTGSNSWADVPGQVKMSPYCITNPAGTAFFRLRD